MKVIKKLGHRQTYEIEKIKDALQRTSKSINEKFLVSDWKELKPRVLSRLNPVIKDRDEIYTWEIDDVVIDSLLCSRFKNLAREYIETRSKFKSDKLNDLGLSPLAMWLLKERYLRKDDNGNPIETAKEMMCRIATAVASVEKTKELREEYTKKFSEMLCNLNFLPNSPCISSAGTSKRGTWLACFAFEIKDSLDSIFEILKDTAKTFQMGGGVGISISKLREEGSLIKTSNGVSSGPIAFLHLFDVMVETVKSGGFRRGAQLSLIKYNHPDVENFIKCKRKTNKLNNMNISILVDDEFMSSVKNNKNIKLISPKNNKVIKEISANLLLEMIATNIWETGEPGILFYERMNEDNPTPHLGDIKVCNPCVTGDTLIAIADGRNPIPIKDLVNIEQIRIYCTDGHSICERDARLIRKTGILKDVYIVTLNDESSFRATDNHLVLLYNGYYKQVNQLQNGDRLFGFRNSNILVNNVKFSGKEDVYNMEVEDYHNFAIVTKDGKGIILHNCAESSLLDGEACDLGSINLMNHIDNGDIDWDKLANTTRLGIRFLDNMLDGSPYPTKKIENAVKRTRKIGLGIMGFADLLIHLNIKYSSTNAIKFAEKIMSFINDVASKESEEIGKEKGLYPAYMEGYRKRRNSIVTTLAPTGCSVGDTYVFTQDGMLSLSEINPNKSNNIWKNLSIKIPSLKKIEDCNQFYNGGFANVKTIYGEYGTEYKSTPNHKYRVFDFVDNKIIWKRVDELKVDDYIVKRFNQYPYNLSYQKLKFIKEYDKFKKSKTIKVPSLLDENISKLIGYYMADGMPLSKNKVEFTTSSYEPECKEFIMNTIRELFGLEGTIIPRKDNQTRIVYYSKQLNKFFRDNGFTKINSYNASIPNIIRKSPRNVVWAFISGYISGDGCIRSDDMRPLFKTTSKVMAQQLQILMFGLGIQYRIIKENGGKIVYFDNKTRFGKSKDSYSLMPINKNQRNKLLAHISFMQSNKEKLRIYALNNDIQIKNNQQDFVPLYENDIRTKKVYNVMYQRKSKKQTIKIPRTIMSHNKQNPFIKYNLSLEKIKEIKNSDSLSNVYDISVPSNNTYISNGALSHNSLSLICGVSSGIEPNFAREYSRLIDYREIKISHPMKDFQNFETTYDISPEQHLNILSEFQKYVENSISKTINVPESITVKQIKELIILGHKLGVKGLTIFRQNCNRTPLIKCDDDKCYL